jgi:SAM-dependent methyltransferase
VQIDNTTPPDEARKGNRDFWDEVTPLHLKSYNPDQFLEGAPWLPKQMLKEVGDVNGLSLLHLQCHFGLDTLAWARLGAQVTGVDFSPKAIEAAQDMAKKADLPAHFICADIYKLPEILQGEFDIVFTSIGVLCWLNDLDAWARIIAHFLKPVGFFYIMEGHPLLTTFDFSFDGESKWTFQLPYFHNQYPYFWGEETTDYMDPSYHAKNPTYEWQWTVSDIINAIIRAGLRIDFFNEFVGIDDPVYPGMVRREDGLFTFPGMPVELPILFSLKASKEK